MVTQFRSEDGDARVAGQTQTDRYRWIRMRLAMRKYGELAREIEDGAPLYRELAKYVVPSEVSGWFTSAATATTSRPFSWASITSGS